MTTLLILDFETKDPYIGLGLGAGWCFASKFGSKSEFFPIGYSYSYLDTETGAITRPIYERLTETSLNEAIENSSKLKTLLHNADIDALIMHNAQYDLGCLISLGIDIRNSKVYDTRIMAALYDSGLQSYSLDYLLTKYFHTKKDHDALIKIVEEYNLCPKLKSANKTYRRDVLKYAYSNMNILQSASFSGMAQYANMDITGTGQLFKFLYKNVGEKLSAYYSNIQRICVYMRAPGIKIDENNLHGGIELLDPVVRDLEGQLIAKLGQININSPTQLLKKMKELGYTDFPRTAADGESVRKEYLEEHIGDPLCAMLLEYRTTYKLLNDFLVKTRDNLQYTHGFAFPELNVLAARTGRFSSSNPNIQNIPKRNKEFAKYCRAIFTVENPDNNWYSSDWSNQEGRLQLHYAYLNKFQKSEWWLSQFKKDPNIDTHLLVAKMMFHNEKLTKDSEERTKAKTIYLGKSFCMGGAKLCGRLGLPSEFKETKFGKMKMAGTEGQKLIDAFDRSFPYLKELQQDCMKSIQEKGYIRTLGGRRFQRPKFVPGERSLDYKAISGLIQGSALDQMCAAMTMCYDAGINMKCVVHDEINIEGQEKDAKLLKEIMESCVDIEVPSVAEVSVGSNWGNTKKLEVK